MPKRSCPSNLVPPEVMQNQLDGMEKMQQECEKLGGTLSTRVLYGCSNTPIKDYKGSSPRTPYEDPNGTPLDYLPDPITGRIPTEEEVQEIVKQRREEALRKALEEAASAAKNKAACESQGGDPAFVVQGFCQKTAGQPIGGTVTLPPFIVQR